MKHDILERGDLGLRKDVSIEYATFRESRPIRISAQSSTAKTTSSDLDKYSQSLDILTLKYKMHSIFMA
jgi:hypothetical protein